jgi:hypothetical protein
MTRLFYGAEDANSMRGLAMTDMLQLRMLQLFVLCIQGGGVQHPTTRTASSCSPSASGATAAAAAAADVA